MHQKLVTVMLHRRVEFLTYQIFQPGGIELFLLMRIIGVSVPVEFFKLSRVVIGI